MTGNRPNIICDAQFGLSLFNDVYIPYLDAPKPLEIFYGGSSSGKSNFLAHRMVIDVLQGGHNYLCLRKLSKSVGKSLLNEVQKAITNLQVGHLFRVVPSQGHATCINGFQILFSGMDDPEKIKSITPANSYPLTDVWYEEATEATLEDIKQLRKRLRGLARYQGKETVKRIILSFNPIYKTHWLVGEYFTPNGWQDDQTLFEDEGLRILKTTYKDNRFLTEQDCQALEDETDKYWFDVYTLGNWGVLGDAIITNWESKKLSSLRANFDRIRNGFDFGYSSDPNAFVRLHYDKKKREIFIFDGWEELKLTNPQIARRLAPTIGEEPIFCDSAEPKSIAELQADGIDARPVKKGKDSILHGIKWLRQHKIYVDPSLQHIINELNTWSWKQDKDGKSLPIPEDRNNHSMDALRYATEIEHSSFFEGLV